jgi:putative Mg2+ transporter-C (MgtC) family protein
MTDVELTMRLLMAVLFGTAVGLERQWHHKTAGLKTNTLVALGATAFTILSEHGFGPNNYLPQVAAGVVTGIGFIGGGVIMRRGGSVQGINSAATLWATASIGLSIGAGYYQLAWLLLALVLSIQFFQHRLAEWIDRRSNAIPTQVTCNLFVLFSHAAADNVRQSWAVFTKQSRVTVFRYTEASTTDSEIALEAAVALSETQVDDLTALTQGIGAIPGVGRAEWFRAKSSEDDRDK